MLHSIQGRRERSIRRENVDHSINFRVKSARTRLLRAEHRARLDDIRKPINVDEEIVRRADRRSRIFVPIKNVSIVVTEIAVPDTHTGLTQNDIRGAMSFAVQRIVSRCERLLDRYGGSWREWSCPRDYIWDLEDRSRFRRGTTDSFREHYTIVGTALSCRYWAWEWVNTATRWSSDERLPIDNLGAVEGEPSVRSAIPICIVDRAVF